MARFEETQGSTGDSEEVPGQTGNSAGEEGGGRGTGLPEDVLDAATGAAGITGSGGPTDAGDLGRFGAGVGDLAGRDMASEGLSREGGAATTGTDIGSGSS